MSYPASLWTGPRAKGTNARATGRNPRKRGTNPRKIGTSPRWQHPDGRARLVHMAHNQQRRQLHAEHAAAWIRAEQAAWRLEMARELGKVCARCEGSGWEYLEAGGVVRCDHQGPTLAELGGFEERPSWAGELEALEEDEPP